VHDRKRRIRLRRQRTGLRFPKRLLCFEELEVRLPMTANFAVSEFLADNNTGFRDRFGDESDWIEIHNSGDTAGSLNGYYLRDSSNQWQFPNVSVAAGGYLVVFASGRDLRDPTQELHTNFSLKKEGEYLGLIAPNGTTVVQEFAPAFPAQSENVSYGPGQVITNTNLVSVGSNAKTIVPTTANHSTYDAVWKSPSYVPDVNWISGTNGAGYGQTFNGFQVKEYQANISASSPIGTTLDSISEVLELVGDPTAYTSVSAGNYATLNFRNNYSGAGNATRYNTGQIEFPGQTSGTDYNHVATEVHALITIPAAGAWTFGLDHNEGYLLQIGDFEASQDGTGSTERFHTFTFDAPGTYDLELYHFERTGSSWLKLYAAPGTFTSFNAAAFDLVGDTANGGLAVKSDLVGSSGSSISQLLGTNVQAQMQGVNPDLYTRIAFNVNDPAALDQLKLRTRYDDGFVAYLNGVEVARKNAPGAAGSTVAYNAIATQNRNTDAVLTAEDFDITSFLSLLTPGQNVLAVQCLNFSANDPEAFVLPELIGTDIASTGNVFFTTPTPGAANGDSYLGIVKDTKFNADRGFYSAPFNLEITSETQGAKIYYTLDGSEPTEASGILYAGPVLINKTITLRAAAFKAGYAPTNVDTETYFFVNDIVQQTSAKTLQLGFPTTWGSSVPNSNFPASVFVSDASYGLDPDIVGNFNANGDPIGGDLYGGVFANELKDALQSIPSISIVMNMNDLFSANTGIITNASERSSAWERAASIEWISPDGASDEFQIDAGIRIQGAFFRSNTNNLKKSFRLLFKNIYGAGKLDFPLFDDGTVDSFNTLVLRGGGNDGYTWNSAKLTEQYTRDAFMHELQLASGNASPHSTFAHLYINGVYWGLYNPVERPDNEFAASYLGGDPDNYDVVHRGGSIFEAQSGDFDAWNSLMALAEQAQTSQTAYMQLQGKNLDGTPNPATPALLDLTNYIDYIIVNSWAGNWDWPRNNFYAARDRDPSTTTGFHFFNWDGENTMGNNLSRSPLNADVFNPATLPGSDWGQNEASGDVHDNAGRIHILLRNNPEYRQLFADRAQVFLFNHGILAPESLIPRFQDVSSQVELAMIGESARWGDMQAHRTPTPNRAITPADWVTERDWILNSYLPSRSGVFLNQLKTYGFYPTVNAPAFNQFGGNYAGGFRLSINSANSGGTLYYTLDGSDPRLFGGALSSSAKTFATPILLSGNVTVKARYLSSSGVWSALTEAPFTQNAIGTYPGDLNRDGKLTSADLVSMLRALTDIPAYQSTNQLTPAQFVAIADLSGDGVVSNVDIQSLINALIAQEVGNGAGAGSTSGESSLAASGAGSVVIEPSVTSTTSQSAPTLPAAASAEDISTPIAGVSKVESTPITTSAPRFFFSSISTNDANADARGVLRLTSGLASHRDEDATANEQNTDFYLQLANSRIRTRSENVLEDCRVHASDADAVDDLFAGLFESEFALT
jgi:hypothetical protein